MHQEGPEPLPAWQRREELGFWRALGETALAVLLRPGSFFRTLPLHRSFGEGLLFFFVVQTIWLCLDLGLGLAFSRTATVTRESLAVALAVLPFALIGGIFVTAGFLHLFVALFGGQGGYRGTFAVIAYAGSAAFLGIFPFAGFRIHQLAGALGLLIQVSWTAFIYVNGYRFVHGCSPIRAVFVFFSPFLTLFVFLTAGQFFLPRYLSARIARNERHAEAVLTSVQDALERYARDHNGMYPKDELALKYAYPPYLKNTYHHKEISGYVFSVTFGANTYALSASPSHCGSTGNRIMGVRSGENGLSFEPCRPPGQETAVRMQPGLKGLQELIDAQSNKNDFR